MINNKTGEKKLSYRQRKAAGLVKARVGAEINSPLGTMYFVEDQVTAESRKRLEESRKRFLASLSEYGNYKPPQRKLNFFLKFDLVILLLIFSFGMFAGSMIRFWNNPGCPAVLMVNK